MDEETGVYTLWLQVFFCKNRVTNGIDHKPNLNKEKKKKGREGLYC